MIKKLVTISFITAGIILLIIILLGLFLRQPNGSYGWQQLLSR